MRRKRHKIAALLLTLSIVGFLVLFFWLPVLKRAVQGVMIAELSRRLDAQVSVSSFGLSFFPPRFMVQGLQVRKDQGPLRYIGVGSATIEPGVGPIFLGQVSIRKLEIENPSIHLDLTDQTPANDDDSKHWLRLPTLSDLIRIQIDEIGIRGVSLSMRLPGEDVRVEAGSGEAAYQSGGGRSERWSWQGSGRIFRGDRSLALDEVKIVADRLGQSVTVEEFKVRGIGASVVLKGSAYPEANLSLRVEGDLESLERSFLDLGVLSKPLRLGGVVSAEGQVQGAWDSLKWSGEFEGTKLRAENRKIPRLAFSFLLDRREFGVSSGEVDFGGGKASFSLSSIRAGHPGTFTLRSAAVPFQAIQKLIDPLQDSLLVGPINISVDGLVGYEPFSLSGSCNVSSPHLSLVISEILQPYLPLTVQNLDLQTDFGWSPSQNYFLENGQLQMKGSKGTFAFQFPREGDVKGVWEADLQEVGSIFPKGDAVRGMGKITGGLTAGKGSHEALLKIHLEPFGYLSHPEATVDGEIVIRKGWTDLRGFRFQAGQGLIHLDGSIPIKETDSIQLESSFADFDLGWISDTAARRFPLWKGVTGVGSGSVSLSGQVVDPVGTIKLESKKAFWRGEEFDRLTALVNLKGGEVEIQKGSVVGNGFSADVSGVVGAEAFRHFQVEAKRFPLTAISLPAFLLPVISHVGGHIDLDGDLEDPSIRGDLRFSQIDSNQKTEGVGRGQLSGDASNLAWNIDLKGGAVRAEGRVNALNGTSFEGIGMAKELLLDSLIPATSLLITGEWDLRSDPALRTSWNGLLSLSELTVERGEWKSSLSEPTTIRIQDGSIQLPGARFSGESTDLHVNGIIRSNNELSFSGNGTVAMTALTLLPLKLTRAEGVADLDVKLGGNLFAPLVTGRLGLRGGLLQFEDFPHAVEEISASAVLEQKRIFFDQILATVGEGKVKASGELLLPGKKAPARVSLNGEVDHVNLRFPSWLPATLSGALSLSGPLSRPLLRGDLVAHEARYQDRWDWQSRVLTFGGTARTARVHRADEENVLFDLYFRTEGDNFLLRNNLAKAAMRGELRLVGSDLNLGLLGKVEVLDGEVTFLDNLFELSPGLVTFDREDSIHMLFDLNAKTRVQETDIFLEIRTERDKTVALLSSLPTKDETSIISLLTLGVDTDELLASGSGDPGLSSSVLPTVLSGAVQSHLETGLRKAHLVDTFQFVPYFSEETKTTGLRMIVGKELFPTVRLLYSTDILDAGSENTVSLEQKFSDHVSLQGSFTDNKEQVSKEEYGLGLDFEFKFEF